MQYCSRRAFPALKGTLRAFVRTFNVAFVRERERDGELVTLVGEYKGDCGSRVRLMRAFVTLKMRGNAGVCKVGWEIGMTCGVLGSGVRDAFSLIDLSEVYKVK